MSRRVSTGVLRSTTSGSGRHWGWGVLHGRAGSFNFAERWATFCPRGAYKSERLS